MRGLACFRAEESLARRPRTPDPWVVRPLGEHRAAAGDRRGAWRAAVAYGTDAPALGSISSSQSLEVGLMRQ
jgi:hypothetical protein